jgi:ubiquinone/menaquinone biosynthesis C-methylase UbiE
MDHQKMQIKYLRVTVFYLLLGPFQRWARKRRMERFLQIHQIGPGERVLDLGGTPTIWNNVPVALNITILNLPPIVCAQQRSHHFFEYVEGDACDVRDFENRSFAFVFSNSVIEHVGDFEKRAAFAREVRRLGRSYWVQTPCRWFPIEPHCGMPFWWFYPQWLRRLFIERWREKLPAWTEMVDGTTVVSKKELQSLFPEATVLVERVLGMPKSLVASFIVGKGQS